MELSVQKTKEAKKLGFSVNELVMADLLSLGYSEIDAYSIAFPEDMGLKAELIRSNREKTLSSAKFKILCEDRRIANASHLEFSGDAKDIDLIDSQETAKEILRVAKQMPLNSKERGEMFMKYADLTRKNDAETEDKNDAINFYFPIKCHQCPFLEEYNKLMEQSGEHPIRPVEMEGIIRKVKKFINKVKKKGGE